MIANGHKVSLEYTVFLEDGSQIDSNVGDSPLVFVIGANQVFPALEQALMGLKVGDTKKVVLKAEEAYGLVVPEAFREVDLETIPAQYRHEGAVLGVQDPQGGVFPIRVHKIQDTKAILDFNHPLAGKALHFQLTVKAVG